MTGLIFNDEQNFESSKPSSMDKVYGIDQSEDLEFQIMPICDDEEEAHYSISGIEYNPADDEVSYRPGTFVVFPTSPPIPTSPFLQEPYSLTTSTPRSQPPKPHLCQHCSKPFPLKCQLKYAFFQPHPPLFTKNTY